MYLLLCPAFPRFGSGRALAGGVGRGCQAGSGGRWTVSKRWVQACCHRQLRGRCRVIRRAERAIRAGMWIRWARRVAVLALA